MHKSTTPARSCRIVYCGPSECGKTSILEALARLIPARQRGKLVRLATETDRTLYFDHMVVDLNDVPGGHGVVRIDLFTVPGQSFYAPARRRVLRDAEGIVFVADSRRERLHANLEALAEVVASVQDAGRDVEVIPAVLQLNKRDAFTAMPVAELLVALGCAEEPHFEAVARTGVGVLETLRDITTRAIAAQPEALFA